MHLPRSLVALFGDVPARLIELDGATVAELIAELDRRWPGMHDRLCQSHDELREHINLFVDGERQRDLATTLGPRSVVHIIPAIAGG